MNINNKVKNCYELAHNYHKLENEIKEDIGAFLLNGIDYNIQWIYDDNCENCKIRIFIEEGDINLKYINQISSYIGIMPVIKSNVGDLLIEYNLSKSLGKEELI